MLAGARAGSTEGSKIPKTEKAPSKFIVKEGADGTPFLAIDFLGGLPEDSRDGLSRLARLTHHAAAKRRPRREVSNLRNGRRHEEQVDPRLPDQRGLSVGGREACYFVFVDFALIVRM